jgi:hypothetical protein
MNCSSQSPPQPAIQAQAQASHKQTLPTTLQQIPSPEAARKARRLFFAMLLVELLLVSFYWLDILLGAPVVVLHALVDLDGEGNLPAWFSSFQLALISLGLWFLVFRQGSHERPSKAFFALPATVFLLWSADETAQMHERLTGWIGLRYVDWLPYFLNQHKALVVLLIVALLAVARFLWRDVVAFWQTHRRLSLIALCGFFVVFMGGAVLETIGYKFFLDGTTPLLYQTEVCLEEFFEMFGASLILYSTSLLAFTKAAQAESAKLSLQPLPFRNNPTV